MQNLVGKYCKDCVIYTDNIEPEALSQIYDIINNPAYTGQKIRIQPDVHAGKNITIGFTSTLGDFVNPSHVGCDIGCTISTVILNKKIPVDKYADFEHKLQTKLRFGFDLQPKKVFDDKEFYKFLRKGYSKAVAAWPEMIDYPDVINEDFITKILKRINMDEKTFYKSIATCGSGNHFVEYGESDENEYGYVTVHCGSRNLGVKVFKYWDAQAKRTMRTSAIYNVDEEIKKIKATVEDRTQWRSLIDAAKEKAKTCNPQGYLSGDKLKGYLNDMLFCQLYAEWNHICIHNIIKDICLKYHCKCIDEIYTKHNYISFDESIHYIRKGAIQSYKGQKMIIPFNMRDGLAICEGKSNDDWNYSAPHGAGRLMSRSAAKKNVDLEVFKKSMEGIYSTCVGMATIDESPMAYKDMNEIVKLIEPTADILFFVKPKINIKATDGGE